MGSALRSPKGEMRPLWGAGFLQERAFDLGLARWVKHGQVKMGSTGNILESEVQIPGAPAGKGFSWAIRDLGVRRAIHGPGGAPRKTRRPPEPRAHALSLSWAPGAG